jgi:outer membrane protein OmpA-like peptidoglycan-associated protein
MMSLRIIVLATGLWGYWGGTGATAEEVPMFDHPPTVEDLERTLSRPKGITRSIVLPSDTQQSSLPAPAPSGFGMNIPFGLNSAQILPSARAYIVSVAGLLSKKSSLNAEIQGHTDISGSRAHNMTLSRERADAVRLSLIRDYGIAPDRLSSVGYGPDSPLPDHSPADPRNRRVQFVFR